MSESKADVQLPPIIQEYINQYKDLALEQEKEYGIPASITLAQGILESAAGESPLAKKTNNHFGIKAGKSWKGKVCYAKDDEIGKSRFRCYNSVEESFEDHARLLTNNHYKKHCDFSVYDYRGWAYGLKNAGYATSDDYAIALIGYIEKYKLYEINGGVKLRPGKTITITKIITREQLVEQQDLQMEESEVSEEQQYVENIVPIYNEDINMEINNVRCTTLYPGETIYSIAIKYDISTDDILKYNECYSVDDFHEGDVVFLGKKKKKYGGPQDFYRVEEGETLYSVSQKFGIRLANLAKMNNRDLYSHLSEGDTLRLK